MRVISADFVTSAAAGGTAEGIPRDGLPQIAMAGRSNVGKSTLINALGRQKIARTSAAPGKTRLANIYRLTLDVGPGRRGLYLIDLPGYGYARGGADAAAELRAVAEAYFTSATVGVRSPRGASTADTAPGGLVAALLLVDARHPGLESDRLAARWLASMDVDYRVVATKVDKLSRSERARNLRTLETEFDMPPLPIAATSGEGLDELWKMIASLVRVGRG